MVGLHLLHWLTIGLSLVIGAAQVTGEPSALRRSDHAARVAFGEAAPTPQRPFRVGARQFDHHPELQAAVQILAARRPRAALDALLIAREQANVEVLPLVDYLVGRCYAALKDYDAADARYAAAMKGDPALRDHILAERAQQARRRKDHATADALTAQVGPGDPRMFKLNLTLARRALAKNQPDEAMVALNRAGRGVYGDWNRARLARWRADALRHLERDRHAWQRRLAKIWRRWPRTTAGREAQKILVNVMVHSRRDPAPLNLEELLHRARQRARKGREGRGNKLARAARARFPSETRGLQRLLAVERVPKKRPKRALQLIGQALRGGVGGPIRDALLDRRARALRRVKRYDEALALYIAQGQAAVTETGQAAALFEGGRLALWMEKADIAIDLYAQFVAIQLKDGPYGAERARALWTLGWLKWRGGELAEADAHLRALTNDHPNVRDHSGRTYYERATYWRGRIADRRGQTAAAHALWRFLRDRYPLSYYGTLAQDRLGMSDPQHYSIQRSAQIPAVEDLEVEGSAAPAVALLRAGLLGDGRRTLRHLLGLRQLGPGGRTLLAALYLERDEFEQAHRLAQLGYAFDRPPEGPDRWVWLAAFPQAFPELVNEMATRHNIDPLLVWSIMRQESSFRASARSHAKALGLMQVLFKTARGVAKNILRETKRPSKRFVMSPEGNVHYGAAFLAHLLKRYEGNHALAIAAYNAGPGAVNRWIRRWPDLETDELVESIPFDEARGYTRKVLRSYAAYRALYGPQDEAPWTLPRALPKR